MAQLRKDAVVGDRYQIQREIGRGGFGFVYAAIDHKTGRTVALKTLQGMADERRFDVELRALMQLDHPNCLRVLDHGHHAGSRYLVTEFIDGPTLTTWLDSKPPPGDRALVAIQLGSSLAHAHANGVIHRDLKPTNVLLTREEGEWSARILDFGLAKLAGVRQPDITATGEVIGTPGFMSPEQLRGLDQVGPKSDMYCLGVVLFELFDDRPPFYSENSLELCMLHLSTPAPALRSGSPALQKLVARLLDKDPKRRPTASVALAQLEAALGLQATQPLSGTKRAVRWGAIAAAVFMMALVALVVSNHESEPPRPVPPVMSSPPALVRSALTPEVEPDLGTAAIEPRVESTGSPGCGNSLQPGEQQTLSVLVGLSRSEVLGYVPADYRPDQPHPLIIALHEGNQEPSGLLHELQLAPLADELGAVVVAPAGKVLLQRVWGVDPVGVIQSARAIAEGAACIDPARVVLLGHGVGSRAAITATCASSSYRAAVLSNMRLDRKGNACDGEQPPPTLFFFTRPYRYPRGCVDDGSRMPILEQVSQWRDRHGCKDGNRRTMPHAECHDWTCDVPLTTCLADGGVHWRQGFGSKCDGPPSPFDHHTEIIRFLTPLLQPGPPDTLESR